MRVLDFKRLHSGGFKGVASLKQDPNLDILRSIAVLSVFCTHWVQVVDGLPLKIWQALGIDLEALGQAGVLLFFVHTCRVLMQSLEDKSAMLSGWPLARHFYTRRAFRVYPLSTCLILLAVACRIPPNALHVMYRWQGMHWLAGNLLLMQNIFAVSLVSTPLWSLPHELQMYLVLPLLFWWLNGRGIARLATVYAGGVALSAVFPHLWTGRGHLIFHFVPCFLGGVLAYGLASVVQPRAPAWLWSLSVLAVILAYVKAPYSDATWAKDSLLCAVVGLMIPWFRSNRGASSKIAAWIARYSYGIYLAHTPLLWLIYRHSMLRGWRVAALFVVATISVSVAAYYVIEAPLIRLGTRIANRHAAHALDRVASPASA
jgi:peptidoglycan/LPS O-acetylase OafA/YrhL